MVQMKKWHRRLSGPPSLAPGVPVNTCQGHTDTAAVSCVIGASSREGRVTEAPPAQSDNPFTGRESSLSEVEVSSNLAFSESLKDTKFVIPANVVKLKKTVFAVSLMYQLKVRSRL